MGLSSLVGVNPTAVPISYTSSYFMNEAQKIVNMLLEVGPGADPHLDAYNAMMIRNDLKYIPKTAPVKAKDNKGREYDVVLSYKNGKKHVKVVGTPGGWYLDSIMDVQGPLAIDLGQGWGWMNVQEVIDSLMPLLDEPTDYDRERVVHPFGYDK